MRLCIACAAFCGVGISGANALAAQPASNSPPQVRGDAAQAQRYPERPIRLIVPNAPGGGTDILARLLAQKAGEALGHPMVVDNRPGAGGIVGTDIAAKSIADGHTLIMVFPSHATNVAMFKKLPFDPIRDFAPVTLLASNSYILAVNPAVPAKSLKELIALATTKPAQLNYAAGRGTAPQLAAELFRMMAKIDITGVPYAGGGPSIAATLSGEAQMTFGIIAAVLPHVQAAKLRALAVTSRNRSKLMPDLPTMSEAGVPGYEAVAWYGVLAPAHTPPAIVSRLDREFKHILQSPDVQERFVALGFEAMASTPDEFRAFMEAEIPKWSKVIRQAGISPL